MGETTEFAIGSEVACSDGVCGEVTRVIVDPVARAVTHLVVEPKQGLARLVPIDLVDATTGELRLSCSEAEFERLDAAEETQFLPGNGSYAGYGPGEAMYWPYYGIGMGGMGVGGVGMGMMGTFPQVVTTETVPVGEIDVRRGEKVHATDGEIGRVQGLVVEPSNHHVTHVLLQEGHLWGRKEVAIPIGAVTGVSDGIRLKLSKEEVQGLPPADVEHPNS